LPGGAARAQRGWRLVCTARYIARGLELPPVAERARDVTGSSQPSLDILTISGGISPAPIGSTRIRQVMQHACAYDEIERPSQRADIAEGHAEQLEIVRTMLVLEIRLMPQTIERGLARDGTAHTVAKNTACICQAQRGGDGDWVVRCPVGKGRMLGFQDGAGVTTSTEYRVDLEPMQPPRAS
jgi:hypothetical protein